MNILIKQNNALLKKKLFQATVNLFIGIFFVLVAHPVKAMDNINSIYFIPHQDDEMFLAGAIQKDLSKKKNVIVVMITDGGASRIANKLNKYFTEISLSSSSTSKTNEITFKKNSTNKQKFTSARNNEFFRSMLRLGVNPSNVLFANAGGINGTSSPLFKDGQLTERDASQIIQKIFLMFGDGSYNTVAGNLGHQDHLAIRNALIDTKEITEKHYYSEIPQVGYKIIPLSKIEILNKKNALKEYFKWNPKFGMFAIGSNSFSDALISWEQDNNEYEIYY